MLRLPAVGITDRPTDRLPAAVVTVAVVTGSLRRMLQGHCGGCYRVKKVFEDRQTDRPSDEARPRCFLSKHKNYAKYYGHYVALAQALCSDQKFE